MKDESLFDRIEAFRFPQAYFPRLLRENHWSREFGLLVMEEYRRFLYLASTAPAPVTPSLAVDQAWHLHLLFTESYWEDLCGGVLPRPLHHGPTRGGAAEDNKFGAWYERTLHLYREEFGEAPPPRVWPAREERFRQSQRWRWLDTSRYWLISKPDWTTAASSLIPLLFFMPIHPLLVIGIVAIAAILVLVVRAVKAGSGVQAAGAYAGTPGSDDGESFLIDGGGDGASADGCGGCGGGGCGGGGD